MKQVSKKNSRMIHLNSTIIKHHIQSSCPNYPQLKAEAFLLDKLGKNIALGRCMLTLIRREVSLANRTKNMCKNREGPSRKGHVRKSALLK